ncbi:hypothetical protein AK51_32635 [Serratia nematodiphila DZ0503SBS1]|nr:hypothetical protein AK51_32635 [Serratia nematodiphila DZ0503SBS1]
MLLHQIGEAQQDALALDRQTLRPDASLKALWADCTASATSCSLASAVVAICCPLAGLYTARRPSAADARHWPSIYSPC